MTDVQVGRETIQVGVQEAGNAQVGREKVETAIATIQDAVVGRVKVEVGVGPAITEVQVGREKIETGIVTVGNAQVGRVKLQVGISPLPPAIVEIGTVQLRIAVGKPIVRTCTQQLAQTSTTKFIRPAHVWRALNMV